ncbi:peptidase M15 [Chromatium weissei]|nr:peptidase M15 [Chromatium weissei]
MKTEPGKRVGDSLYIHTDALRLLDSAMQAQIQNAAQLAGVKCELHYNLVRIDSDGSAFAFLNYSAFFENPFPSLLERWLVTSNSKSVDYRTYANSLNPPILHRKELLLPTDHPRRNEYAALTAEAEAIGLFDEPKRIGYRRQWEQLLRDKGYRLEGHHLVPLGNAESDDLAVQDDTASPFANWAAARQRTALTRYSFSAPIQSLARHGFLDGHYRLFDYGCGRGDDVRGLIENGLTAAGWDPFHAPNQPIQSADIVNLGFVINVIEDFDERLAALTRAWSLAERLLVVSVMLVNQNDPRGERFRDGVMTQRGTFQKYFSQAEIKTYLEQALDAAAIPVAPGVLYVFRDKDAEQRFLIDRYRSRRNHLRDPASGSRLQEPTPRRDRAAEKYAIYQEPLKGLLKQWLSLGRRPEKTEVENLPVLTEGFGSLSKALRFLEERQNSATFEQAAARRADLTVYFALAQFERRRPYSHLERGLQQDIKAFFGDYATAKSQSLKQLFAIADVAAIDDACRQAAEHGLGWLDAGQSLQLHVSLIEQLPPLLRISVGCAAVLYGDYRHADLVKIHIRSGKVSLMRYDDFIGQPMPRLIERVKIKLRDLDIDYFAYGEAYTPPFLFHKSRYINEEFPNYPEQIDFEQALDALGLCDLSGYGPHPDTFLDSLARSHWNIEGFALVRCQTPPKLDDSCGRFLTFRELIECGETQASTGLPNLPLQLESYHALLELAERVLDPVIDYFGMICLIYGFCSPELARRIPARIDPKRDQHAAHEVNRLGKPVCERLGAAVDFLVKDESMLEVAQWLVANTTFDRLYFYEDALPIHVSYGPNHKRQIVVMTPSKSGHLLPRVVSMEAFLKYS